MTRRLVAVTGPSGAGKSTFCRRQDDWVDRLHNLDDWVRRGRGDVDDPVVRESAWGEVLAKLHQNIREGTTPLVIDHVFDTAAVDALIVPAKEHGYEVHTWVVAVDSAEVCVRRVEQRREDGGHGAAEWAVRELYDGALWAASELAAISDHTFLVGNADDVRFEPIAHIAGWQAEVCTQAVPNWARERFLDSCERTTQVRRMSIEHSRFRR